MFLYGYLCYLGINIRIITNLYLNHYLFRFNTGNVPARPEVISEKVKTAMNGTVPAEKGKEISGKKEVPTCSIHYTYIHVYLLLLA